MKYGQFCPIAKAAEIISEKWNIILIRELLAGSDTFNGLRNGIPMISPTLLSKRLQELEDAGLVAKIPVDTAKNRFRYQPLAPAIALGPVLMALGDWGNRFVGPQLAPEDYDPRLLMWDIRRNIATEELAFQGDRYVVHFDLAGTKPGLNRWWLVVAAHEVDVCFKNPRFNVKMTVSSHIKTLTEVWMGWRCLTQARKEGLMAVDGSREDIRSFPKWFKLNEFARREAAPHP